MDKNYVIKRLDELGRTEPEIKYFLEKTNPSKYINEIGKAELTEGMRHALNFFGAGALTTYTIFKTGDLTELNSIEYANLGLLIGTGLFSVHSVKEAYNNTLSGLEKIFIKKSNH